MRVIYNTPEGEYSKLYYDMLQQTHMLIAGMQGSGKTTIIHGLIYTALYQSPITNNFVILDPKRVELYEYSKLPHTLYYASEDADMIDALCYVRRINENRLKEMQKKKLHIYNGPHFYVIIDEMAYFISSDRRQVHSLLQDICMVWRLTLVHAIVATHRPTSDVINSTITANMTARVGLKTRNAQESINIIGASGCEKLPLFGQGYYLRSNELDLYRMPLTTDDEKQRVIDFWMKHRKPRYRFF